MSDLHIQSTVFKGHKAAVYVVIPGEEGEAWSAGSDRNIVSWTLDQSAAPRVLAHAAGIVYALLRIPETPLLLIGNHQGGIHVVDLLQKAETKYLLAHPQGIFDMRYDKQRHQVISCGADGSLAFWEAADFHSKGVLHPEGGKIRKIALHPSGKHLVSAHADGKIRMFDFETLAMHAFAEGHETSANALCFSPDGQLLLSGGRDARLHVYDVQSGALIQRILAHNYAIYHIEWHPFKPLFATASRDKTIKIWDAHTFEVLYRMDAQRNEGHVNSVNSIAWTPDGSKLLSASDDRTVRVWELKGI